MKRIYLFLIFLIMGTQSYSAAGTAVDILRQIPVPTFGHYYSHGYHLMAIPTSYPLTKEQTALFTPTAIDLVDSAPLPNPDFYFSITSTIGNKVHNYADPSKDTIERVPVPWNVLFHGWSGIANNTHDMVDMGVFDIQGIQPHDLAPPNKLKKLQVHPHGVYCSPNNATFSPIPNRQFMSFGLVGNYKEKSIIIYQIIIDNKEAQDFLQSFRKNNITELYYILTDPTFLKFFTNPDDIINIKEITTKLNAIINDDAAPATAIAPEEDDPGFLAALAESAAMAADNFGGSGAAAAFHPDEERRIKEQEEMELALALSTTTAEEQLKRERAEEDAQREREEMELALAQVASMQNSEERATAAPAAVIVPEADLKFILAQIAAMEHSQGGAPAPRRQPPAAPRRRQIQPAQPPVIDGNDNELQRALEERRRRMREAK